MSGAGYSFLLFEIVCVVLLTASLLHHYGNWRRQQLVVTGVTFLAWQFCFLIVFILPTDINCTFYEDCLMSNVSGLEANGTSAPACREPWNHIPRAFLVSFWRVIYWSCQFLTWIFLPIMQSYAKAGEFNVLGKVKASLVDNALYYSTYLLIFAICFIYVATRPDIHIDFAQLRVIGITASNTWGLVLIVLFLGYGLVELPRTVWSAGCPGESLKRAYFRLAKVNSELIEHQEELEDLAAEAVQLAECVPGPEHPLAANARTVAELAESSGYCGGRDAGLGRGKPTASSIAAARRRLNEDEDGGGLTAKRLVKLHCQLKKAIGLEQRSRCLLQEAYASAAFLEDIESNRGSRLHFFRRGEGDFDSESGGLLRRLLGPGVEFYWKCHARSWLLRGAACFLLAASGLMLWCECTFFIKWPVLTPLALLVQAGRGALSVQLICLLAIGYLCACTYFTVFRLKLFNYFRLVPNHQTDENSLIFSGMLFCRLTPPLCLNFLGLVHLDSHLASGLKAQTAYTQLMGHLDLVAIISNGVNLYFPIAILLLALASYFRLGSRLLHCLGVQQFISSDDELTSDLLEEGRLLLRRERARRSRDAPGGSSSTGGLLKSTDSGDEEDELFARKPPPARQLPRSSGAAGVAAAPVAKLSLSPPRSSRFERLLQADGEPVEFEADTQPLFPSARAAVQQQQLRQQPPPYKSGSGRGGFFDDV
uniref:LMBR1 domain-containing protein 2 n=2 Tax=Macrostomum lignano TaxID=282301 RepID=A0A1I8I049_9PLAT